MWILSIEFFVFLLNHFRLYHWIYSNESFTGLWILTLSIYKMQITMGHCIAALSWHSVRGSGETTVQVFLLSQNYYSVTKFFFYRKINIKHLFMKWKHSIQALLKKRQPAVLDNKVQFQSSFILNTYFWIAGYN